MTSRDPNVRWNNGRGYINSPVFSSAIKKYGWNGFYHYIIASKLIKTEAQNFEKLLIELCKTQDRDYGYNMADGGTGGNQKQRRKVRQYDLNGHYIATYESAAEAARSVNSNRSRITGCCRKREKSAEGYLWCYETDKIDNYISKKETMADMYDLDGKFIRTFRSMAQASNFVDAPDSCTICENCRKVIYSCYGYRWTYHGSALRKSKVNKKRVAHYDLNGRLIKVYGSMTEAKNENNISFNILYKLLKEDSNEWKILERA